MCGSLKSGQLFNYTSNYPVTRLICDWLVYVALIFFGLREFLLIYRERWRYFLKIWNFLEFVNLLTSAATIAFSVGHAIIADQVSKEANKDQGHFYNFQTLAMWDQLFAIMAAFSSFLSTLQVLHLLRFNKRMSILGATMKLSATDLAPFSIVFAIVILAFASFCVLTFGSFLTDYRNVLQTLESLMLVSLGKFDYESLYEVSPILTPVFILLYMTCVIFLLINFLITILMDSFAQVRDDVNKQPNDYELVDYIVGTMTHLLWQYNPFKFFWSLAVFFGIVSHSKPKSERGKSVQSGTNNDLAVATVKPSKKKMLTKVQINFLKSEIGLDLVEDSLDGLENNIDAIYRMMLTFCSGKLNRKSNNWRKAIVELHVPSLIALDASRDQKSVENTSQSFDPSDMTPSPYIGRNISPSLPAVRHKVLLTPARKMELATVEHSLRAYDDTGSNVDDVTAMEDSTNTSCLTNSPAAVVPSYCPSPAPPVTRSYRPPALKRLEPPSLSVEPSATPSYLPSALDRSSVSPAGVVPRLSWSTSSVSPAGSEDNVSFPRDKFLRPATPVVSFPRDKVFSPATPVVSFPRDKVFSPATPVVSFPRDKVFSPATHNLTFSKDKATLSSRTPNASFTRDTILSPITPIGVVPTLETNMKPKRRLLNRAKFYYDDSFELSMFPTEWDRQLPWKHMDKRHAKVDRHFDRLHVDHPTDQLNPIHSRERLESESIP
ncbi:hypothetical protein Btru_005724 [Bulinus truncatus]|nr:hypothetical protein Btru_005724 [Bulinus truncatus]